MMTIAETISPFYSLRIYKLVMFLPQVASLHNSKYSIEINLIYQRT